MMPWVVRADRTMIKGLEAPAIFDEFYEDEFGNWGISGYAPIRNDEGEVVGGLGVDFSASVINEVQQAIQSSMVAAFVVTYLVFFTLVVFFARALTRPVVALTVIANQIAEGNYEQNLNPLLNARVHDEITRLAEVFEYMIAKVRQREESLRQKVAELRIEIDQTKKHQQVQEIVETDFFADLQKKARELRQRNEAAATDE